MYNNFESKIKSEQFAVIYWYIFNVIRGPRPANLDHRIRLCVTSGDDTKVEQCGRSMIEMLGVLAIIGVLSVGGIAGYSKAMEKWKRNKVIGDYSMMIFGLTEHLNNLKSEGDSQVPLIDVVEALDLLPKSYTRAGYNSFYDTMGNLVYPYTKNSSVIFSIKIGGFTKNSENVTTTEGFSTDFCVELFNNLVKPLSSEIYRARVWSRPNNIYFYGAKYCLENEKCLPKTTLKDYYEACNSCDKKNTDCDISLEFK